MLTTEQINDLHRLYWSDHWPIRKIERHLHMGWDTIKKYLDMPAQTPAGRPRSSKLDPYKARSLICSVVSMGSILIYTHRASLEPERCSLQDSGWREITR